MSEESPKQVSKNQMGSVQHAHDLSFKEGMKDIRVAKDILRHHLPQEIKEKINIETLGLEDGTFVDPELRVLHTDILYSVDLINSPSHEKAYIYVHLEHQSTGDPIISFRMIKYCVRIIDRHIRNTGSNTLPVIIPVVLYNGEREFSDCMSIFDLFGENREIANKYMFNTFHLVDMNTIPDEEIRQYEWSCLMESILKHIHARDIMAFLEEISPLFHSIIIKSNTADHVMAMVKYLIEKAEIRDRHKFLMWAKKTLPPQLEKQAMTLAEQWKLEGTIEGEKALLKRQLAKRFGSLPAKYQEKLDNANAELLLEFGDKIIEAKTLDDVFATRH